MATVSWMIPEAEWKGSLGQRSAAERRMIAGLDFRHPDWLPGGTVTPVTPGLAAGADFGGDLVYQAASGGLVLSQAVI